MISCIAIVIPLYNHGDSVRQVVQDALALGLPVIVVDDGSTDGGTKHLHDLPITCLRHAQNRGKGAAIRSGAAEARRQNASHIITLDADSQHKPEDIRLFLPHIQQQPHAIIVGARDFSVAHVPASSRFGRAFSGFWMRVQTGLGVSDMQSGFRCYPLEIFDCLSLSEKHYSFEVEVLVKAAWAGFAIVEVPISVYYPPPHLRRSHFLSIRDNVRISLLNTKLTVRALLPVPFKRYALNKEGGISLRHPLQSLRLLLGQQATPWHLARSAAWSISISTLPLPGLQSILLLLAIGSFKLHRLCALALVPLTWPPVVPGLCVLAGYYLRHGTCLTEFSVQTLGYEAGQRFWEWIIGALCLAPLLGIFVGGIVWCMAHVVMLTMNTEEMAP